jgi:cytochrome c551/c552
LAQGIELPSDPLKGRILFETKGCISCHPVAGYGGTSAPDLADEQYFGSFLSLMAAIWNHIPEMDRKYRELDRDRPRFTESELLNLTGFIYYLRYLGQPGSVAEGERLLTTKGCTTCHGLDASRGRQAPGFREMGLHASPLQLVQAMWNHLPAMERRMQKNGLRFPTLDGNQVADMSAYLQMAAASGVHLRVSPGNPVRGEEVFETKKCTTCHATGPIEDGPDAGPALSDMDLRKSVAEIAGLMWNHSEVMRESMANAAIAWPRFDGNEMADLLAYLYFVGFEDEPGGPVNGSIVFEEKGCANCHKKDGTGAGPDLSAVRRLDNPMRMGQLMWNHAPEMEDLLLSTNEPWPELSAEEMSDLLAFIQRNASTAP